MTISPAQKLNTNVWLAELDPGEVRSIGLCDQSEGIISIIRTGAAACPTNEGGVQVDPNDTRVLNVGRSSQAVIIVDPDPTAVVENGLPHAEEDRGRFESLGRFSGGDEEFLQSCTADLRSLALELLRNIRREFPGVLEFQSPSKK